MSTDPENVGREQGGRFAPGVSKKPQHPAPGFVTGLAENAEGRQCQGRGGGSGEGTSRVGLVTLRGCESIGNRQ